MGINGLLPFLEKASKPVNIKEYSGCTVAVDTYCWLHKGAFSCAEKLARGEQTDQYVLYCMKFVNMLLSHNIKPILVFDGRHLPAKADTEKTRKERRDMNRKKAAELLRADRIEEARNLIRRCVDVTHEMASALMNRCRSSGVDYIVAPYEADAQLAFFSITGVAHVIITEDSDLLLFGCKKVLFKMDAYGNGLLVDQALIPLTMKQPLDQFSLEKFRYMCILSGCDYLPSLHGIGLAKALKFIKRTADDDIYRALSRLGAYLNMKNLVVTQEYKDKFKIAVSMFKYQPVYNPFERKLTTLNPLPKEESLPIDEQLPSEIWYQLALGNLNPFSLDRTNNWDPDNPEDLKSAGWNSCPRKNSIWSRDYKASKQNVPKKIVASFDKYVKRIEKPKSQNERKNFIEETISPNKKNVEVELNTLRNTYGIKSPKYLSCLDLTNQEQKVETLNHQEDLTVDELFDVDELQKENKSSRNVSSYSNSKISSFNKSNQLTPSCGALAKMSKLNTSLIEVSGGSIGEVSRYFGNFIENEETSVTSVVADPPKSNTIDENTLKDIINTPTKLITHQRTSKSPETPRTTLRNVFSTSPTEKFDVLDTSLNKVSSGIPSFLGMLDNMVSPRRDKNLQSKVKEFVKTPKQNRQAKLSFTDTPTSFESSSKSTSHENLTGTENVEPIKVAAKVNRSPYTMTTHKKSINSKIGPARTIGLKRKKSCNDDYCKQSQPSIFDMFAFQPKAKLKMQ